MIGPISPDEVHGRKLEAIPQQVFEAFNELIAQNFSHGAATVRQKTVVDNIIDRMGCSREEIYNKHWLDIEDLYRNAGWKVEYDKPGYNESGNAYFKFKKP